jgi:hypothetical protein
MRLNERLSASQEVVCSVLNYSGCTITAVPFNFAIDILTSVTDSHPWRQPETFIDLSHPLVPLPLADVKRTMDTDDIITKRNCGRRRTYVRDLLRHHGIII